MKIFRSIVGTLALCGTVFFTNMVYAGDCGSWVDGGEWQQSTVTTPGDPANGLPPTVSKEWYFKETQTWSPTACEGSMVETEPQEQSRSQKITQALSDFKLGCRTPGTSKALYQAEQVGKCTNEVYGKVEADLWAFGPWKWWVKVSIGWQCTTKVATELALVYEADIDKVPLCN